MNHISFLQLPKQLNSFDDYYTWLEYTIIPKFFISTDYRGKRLSFQEQAMVETNNLRITPWTIRQLRMLPGK